MQEALPTLSLYQRRVLEFVRARTGHGAVRATAGAGKTTTLVQVAAQLPEDLRIYFLAFGKDATDESKTRLPNRGREMGKNLPYIYALGDAGADYLARYHGVRRDKVRWREKNQKVGRDNIRHTLETSDVMVAFEVAFRAQPNHRFVYGEEVVAPGLVKDAGNPFEQATSVVIGGVKVRLPVEPDGVFAYELPNGERVVGLLETDRATMTVLPKTLKGSSLYKKFLGYHSAFMTKELRGWWRGDHYLVFVVTSSEARIGSMREALARAKETLGSTRGNNFFIFGEASSLNAETILTIPWIGGAGKSFIIVQ